MKRVELILIMIVAVICLALVSKNDCKTEVEIEKELLNSQDDLSYAIDSLGLEGYELTDYLNSVNE